ncbi:MAG: pectin esterase, partial [Muribaculaceae bacterium]|nr:pectin esterase [Muribaculaceae bacterium]
MKIGKCLLIAFMLMMAVPKAWSVEYMREITVAADGSGDFRTITEALEAIRAYMDYKVTVHIKNGEYHEKVIIPSWLENVDFIGEDPEKTIITYNDYAKLDNMGTFRTYTMRVDGCDLTFKNLTIRNNAGRVGQAVALHTEGTDLTFENCRFIGDQDTLFLAGHDSKLSFENCYIEGTTDFIFGPATVWFEGCEVHSKADSYVTAASTPNDVEFGYVFKDCKLTADPEVTKVYLGRPWRPYAYTAFIDCELGKHIVPAGWDNWRDPANEKTARYIEHGSKGSGSNKDARVKWARDLSDKEAAKLTKESVLGAK